MYKGNIPCSSYQTPLLPDMTVADSLCPEAVFMQQVRKWVSPPLGILDLSVTLGNTLMRVIHPGVQSSNHDLCTQWSINIALETCLCLKSYLVQSWVWPNQVINTICGVGGHSLTDNTPIVMVVCTRRITSQRSSRVDVGHVRLAIKVARRNTLISPNFLITISKTLIRHSGPLPIITTPTSCLWPILFWLSQISSQFIWFTCSPFYCYDPLLFPLLCYPFDHSWPWSCHSLPFWYHYCSILHHSLISCFIAVELYQDPLFSRLPLLLFSCLSSHTYSTWYPV